MERFYNQQIALLIGFGAKRLIGYKQIRVWGIL